MKRSKFFAMLPICFLIFYSSCKKTEPGNEPFTKETLSAQRSYDVPNRHCLPTHLEDDAFGYSVDLFYNDMGDPDSLSFNGFPATYRYDKNKRLIKAVYGPEQYGDTRSFYDYAYNDNTFLPSSLKYYSPLNGGLLVTLNFLYNKKGQMIRIDYINAKRPIYNSSENYTYDQKGNVIKVVMAASNGGTIYDIPFTEYEVLSYDNKQNFMGGNQWLKYMFFYTELYDYEFMMFSKNNVVDWLWRPEAYSFYFPEAYYLQSTLDYNHQGFANKVNIRFFDFYGAENYFEFARTSSSTCDDQGNGHSNKNNLPLRKNPNLVKKSLDKVPSVTAH